MSRVFVLIASAASAVLLAVAVAAVGYRQADVTPAPPSGVTRPPAVPPTAPLLAPALTRRSGRVLTLDDALKELDLIRPGRARGADEFSVAMLDGRTFRLGEQRGKVVFVNFWATWCPPCRAEMPAMERLYARHRDAGFVMLAVSVDADPAVVKPFVTEGRFSFSVGLDPKMEVANAYGVRALPSSFIIDREGKVTAMALGPRAWDSDASHSLVEAMAR
jgi:peroxiredoxin